MSRLLPALALVLACACAASPSSAAPSPSAGSAPATAAGTATPSLPGQGVPVARQALPPATDLPAADLCSIAINTTADGNATPLLCGSGAVNVLAWKFYSSISADILGLGLNPTQGQAEAAVCDDIGHNHATRSEEADAFKLAATYYGWTFLVDAAHDPCI